MSEFFRHAAESPQASEHDRVAGCLVGLAAGDALGAGYEFRDAIEEEPRMIGGGLGPWEPGEWTDDTQMAVCIAQDAYAGMISDEAVATRFLEWFEAHPKDVGSQTSSVLRGADDPGDLAASASRFLERKPNGAGNGSLMRTAPVALAYLHDEDALWDKGRSISALTHAREETQEACAIWCIAIQKAVTEGRFDGIFDGIKRLPPHRRAFWEETLADVASLQPSDLRPNGYVVTALKAAWWSIVTTPIDMECHPSARAKHFSEALRRAVQIGHDTDTVAAIAGSLLGAFWGYSAIPVDWTRQLHGWNPGGGTFNTQDLVRMAHQTAYGPLDETRWPSCESMLGSYYESRTICEPLWDDDLVWMGNINCLKHEPFDFDIVVSLCRVGCSDTPDGPEQVHVFLIDQDGANPHLEWTFKDAAASMHEWADEGKRILLHCVGAHSRTPSLAAAYLTESKGISGSAAIARIREQLPKGWRNPNFIATLKRL